MKSAKTARKVHRARRVTSELKAIVVYQDDQAHAVSAAFPAKDQKVMLVQSALLA